MLDIELPGVEKLCSGKVREVFDLGDKILIVATDRISAFDCVLPNPIPHKGFVLTGLSEFWMKKWDFISHHLIATAIDEFPPEVERYRNILQGRSTLAWKTDPLPVECVVRGYLVGSAWAEYEAGGTAGGYKLPPGLQQAGALPETLFTPAAKASEGHDQNIGWKECCDLLGEKTAQEVREMSIAIYEAARAYAATRGILIADTKFEFGRLDGRIVLIDECLTPDSSRFWPTEQYKPGANPPSFDKQFVRDYLESVGWDKKPPAPSLPPEVVRKTSEKYVEAFDHLTGQGLSVGRSAAIFHS